MRSASFETLESRRLMDSAAPEDAYEPNDSPRQVLALTAPGGSWLGGVEGNLEIGGLSLSDRADWFRFRLTTEGQPGDSVSIAFRNRRGNLDLSLFNGRGRVELGTSATNQPTESVSLDGLEAGWYMGRITGRDGARNGNYRLSLDCPIPAPEDDGGGDNGGPGGNPIVEYNDSFDLVDIAPVAAVGSPSLGIVTGQLQIAGQQLNDTYDIFKFTISAASPPAAGASVAIISATPFNLSLFGAQRQSLGLAAGYMGQTSLSLAGLAPGDYYLQVTHYVLGLSGSFEYSLAFDVGAAAE